MESTNKSLCQEKIKAKTETYAEKCATKVESFVKSIVKRLEENDSTLTGVKFNPIRLGVRNSIPRFSTLNNEHLKRLANALKENTQILRLNFNGNGFGIEGLKILREALEINQSLTVLTLKENKIDALCADLLAKILEKNKTLTNLDLSGEHIHAPTNCLETNNDVHNDGAKALGEMLKTNITLKYLGLTGNHIGLAGINFLCDGLSENNTLLELKLNNNELKHPDVGIALAKMLEQNTALRCLDISRSKMKNHSMVNFLLGLKTNTALKELYLMDTNIGRYGAITFGEMLKLNSGLTTLDIEFDSISGECPVRSLASGLANNKTLTSLNLRGNNLGGKGFASLAQMLSQNQALKTLSLARNRIEDDDGALIAKALSDNTTLTSLDLHGNNGLRVETAKAFAQCLAVNSTLLILGLAAYGIRGIGDRNTLELLFAVNEYRPEDTFKISLPYYDLSPHEKERVIRKFITLLETEPGYVLSTNTLRKLTFLSEEQQAELLSAFEKKTTKTKSAYKESRPVKSLIPPLQKGLHSVGFFSSESGSSSIQPCETVDTSISILDYAPVNSQPEITKELFGDNVSTAGKEDDRTTALLWAAGNEPLSDVQQLLGNGASITEKDNDGMTALLSAVCNGQLNTAQWLLENGSSIREEDNEGTTSLLWAAANGYLSTVRWLLGNGASITEKDNEGMTALLLATDSGQLSTVQWLLENGASITEKNNEGMTALLLATDSGQLSTVQWLLENGASITEKNNEGMTALLSAACNGQLSTAQWLLKNGASVTEKDNEGITSLLWAAANGHLDTVQWLLESGANITEKLNSGKTTLVLAVSQRDWSLVQHLLLFHRYAIPKKEFYTIHQDYIAHLKNMGATEETLIADRWLVDDAPRLTLSNHELTINSQNLYCTQFLDVVALLSYFPHITALRFNRCTFYISELYNTDNVLCDIDSLQFHHCTFRDIAFKHLTNKLPVFFPALTQASLTRCGLTNDNVPMLKLLVALSSLTYLNLSGNIIDNEGEDKLLHYLKERSTILHLNLGNNFKQTKQTFFRQNSGDQPQLRLKKDEQGCKISGEMLLNIGP